MNKSKRFASIALCLAMAMGVGGAAACNDGQSSSYTPEPVSSQSLYVKKVDDLPKDFIMGMDASSVPSLEEGGVKYYNFAGEEQDVFKTLADNGINTIRVRVWNDPYDSEGHGYGGGNNDIDRAVEIGKRATKYGMGLMVDFHYSDFWADPAKQMVPKAWKDMDIATKAEALYEYTKESLTKLKDAKVKVTMVQVGNETNGAMCGEKKWFDIVDLMSAGSRATREVFPQAKVALHFANPEKVTNYEDYANKLKVYEVDYDVFASSYYPYWHGTLENLSTLLSKIATNYGKQVMVAETSYAFTEEDSDFYGNTIGAGSGVTKNYPFTVQGQANSIRNIIDTVAHMTNGIGVCYWEGTWISAGGSSFEENSAKWEQYGSGWAASYATEYDPKDAGKYYGGCAVDNQAFFTSDGKPLESLKVFSLVKSGNVVENKPDAVEDTTIICDLKGTIELPEKINAVMLDDSKQAISVTWNVTQADYDRMYNSGVAKYDVTGNAGGMTAHCYISMVEFNFMTNYSFEEDPNKTAVPTGWTVDIKTKPKEIWVEDKATDSLTGTRHFHFWNETAVEFNLEQELTNIKAGKYKYSIAIMGADGGNTDIYAYVKINGEIVKTAPLALTGYNDWNVAWIEGIEYNGTDEITVGIHVMCEGAGNGPWAKIDDALFNSMA